jgi:plastocyanin
MTVRERRRSNRTTADLRLANMAQPSSCLGTYTLGGDRKFESVSLRQRVRCELDLVAGQRNAMIVVDGVDKVKIGDNNVEYAYWPARTRIKAGTTVTFTNVGDIPHTGRDARLGGHRPGSDESTVGKRQGRCTADLRGRINSHDKTGSATGRSG